MASPLPLYELDPSQPARILQLYQDLELLSEGSPPRNTLFVLGRTPSTTGAVSALWREQLLVIDPPGDLTQRFRLADDVAVLFTGAAVDAGAPQVQTQAGGVAHLRIGEHFLDVYGEAAGAVVYFPAVGILLSGAYASAVAPPRLAAGSAGQDELETLRLLARLIKAPNFQLMIPQVGASVSDRTAAMERLAADVAYLHSLRKAALEAVESRVDVLLPTAWQTPIGLEVHRKNTRMMDSTL